ncbi:MAG: hypothetical protein ACRDJ1_02700 [Actinomycetota bacterium]
MKRLLSRSVALAGLVLAVASLGVTPALGQAPPIPTPPPLPPVPYVTPPAQAQPVFELVAPTVYPWCGTAALAVFLAGSSAGPIAPTLLNASTPVFAICGAVPEPPQRLTCLIDFQGQEVINTITRQAGAALPLGLHPAGDAVEQVIVLEDKLPPPANAQGAGALVASVLVCAVPAGSDSTPGDFSQAPGDASFPPPLAPIFNPPVSGPGFLAQPPQQLPPVAPGAPPAQSLVGDAVTYAIVWALPLALLVYGGYFGGALTREIAVPVPRLRRA